MYAIIRAGGKQYKVAEQDVIEVNKLAESEGDEIVLDSVLLVSGEKGISIGTPYVEGAAVHAKVVRHYKGRKIRGFTYRAKKDYHRHYGHRQQLTSLSIEQIKLP
ncbi:MAG: 50S ribosomal protein L21 [Armatimonadetes bacterium RBG_16_58_9]|nr:MAG: 50S ribosomal protein L21 [Armatimonadetes bacterium RBG_16_58_9]